MTYGQRGNILSQFSVELCERVERDESYSIESERERGNDRPATPQETQDDGERVTQRN